MRLFPGEEEGSAAAPGVAFPAEQLVLESWQSISEQGREARTGQGSKNGILLAGQQGDSGQE